MLTVLTIDAHPGRRLRTDVRGDALAVRQTGPGVAHLVGTAAGPLGGDEVVVRVMVAAGAALAVRSVAATLVLPGPAARRSRWRWEVSAAADARVTLIPEPTIVAAGADHDALLEVDAAAGASIVAAERVQLGRGPAEADGCGWSGETRVRVDGVEVLAHGVALGAGSATDDLLAAPRAYASMLRLPDASGDAVADELRRGGPSAVRLAFTGGTVTTALAETMKAADDAERVVRG